MRRSTLSLAEDLSRAAADAEDVTSIA